MSSNRSLIYIGTGILALVAMGVAVVLLAEGRQPETFEPGSPQAAMQAYMAAWDEGDYRAAYAYFSDEVQADATLSEYESEARARGGEFGGGSEGKAAFIDDVEGDDRRVTVHLTTEEYVGDGPGAQSYRTQHQVRMVREADGWKIDEPLLWLDRIRFGEAVN
jgi:hypothetical protein